MKDIHNHILYGLDDGCKNEEESLEILKNIISSGVSEIVFKPHYILYTK